jgi:hypothetical protein
LPFLELHPQQHAWTFDGTWPGLVGPKDRGTMWSIVGLRGCGASASPTFVHFGNNGSRQIWHTQPSRLNIDLSENFWYSHPYLIHRHLWPPLRWPTFCTGAVSLSHEWNHAANWPDRGEPDLLFTVAHGRRSRRASKAHSLLQYLPAFRPVALFLNGLPQHRHCNVLARAFDFAAFRAAFLERTPLRHFSEQHLTPCLLLTKSTPQKLH